MTTVEVHLFCVNLGTASETASYLICGNTPQHIVILKCTVLVKDSDTNSFIEICHTG